MPLTPFFRRFRYIPYSVYTKMPRRSGASQAVDKPIIKPHALKYITNTAENIFSVDRVLIIS